MAYLLFSFQGRIRRTAFWVSVIIMGIVYMLLTLPLGALITPKGEFNLTPLSLIYWGALFIVFSWMSFAIGAKRLHDIGKSGWWQLIIFIPLIGFIFYFYMGLKQTQDGVNRFGNPQPR
jgi:uncharacterized membrane protein YhaH (DUF805 family)